jgi:hypothetical protein
MIKKVSRKKKSKVVEPIVTGLEEWMEESYRAIDAVYGHDVDNPPFISVSDLGAVNMTMAQLVDWYCGGDLNELENELSSVIVRDVANKLGVPNLRRKIKDVFMSVGLEEESKK